MARRKTRDGRELPTDIQSLKRGDKVCLTYWGDKYIKTTVTRVRTVECATIITVEKVEDIPCKRFVGYYTSRIATGADKTVLTIDTYWGDEIEKMLNDAIDRSKTIINRAKALRAMMDLKDWLFAKETFADRDPE